MEPKTFSIGDSTFLHALESIAPCDGAPFWNEFQLNGQYSRFTASVAMNPMIGEFDSEVLFEVLADGTTISKTKIGLGKVETIDLAVAGVQRLRLQAAGVPPCGGEYRSALSAVWGDPAVSHSSKDTATPTLSPARKVLGHDLLNLSGNSDFKQEPVSIEGTVFSRGLSTPVFCERSAIYNEYQIDGRYERFTSAFQAGTISTGTGRLRIEIVGDGVVLFETELSVGEAGKADVRIAGVQRIRLQATELSKCSESGNYLTTSWGEPTVLEA